MKRWLELLRLIGPVLVMTSGNARVRQFGPSILSAIETAEAMVHAPGTEKKAHAMDLIEVGASVYNEASGGRAKVNVPEMLTAASALINGIVGAVNAVERSEAAPLADVADAPDAAAAPDAPDTL